MYCCFPKTEGVEGSGKKIFSEDANELRLKAIWNARCHIVNKTFGDSVRDASKEPLWVREDVMSDKV